MSNDAPEPASWRKSDVLTSSGSTHKRRTPEGQGIMSSYISSFIIKHWNLSATNVEKAQSIFIKIEERITKHPKLYTIKNHVPDIKQLLDEVEHDSENYQGRGLCHLPKPKAEADNTNRGLHNFSIMRKPNPIIVLL